MATYSSGLAWRLPWTGGATARRVIEKLGPRQIDLACTHSRNCVGWGVGPKTTPRFAQRTHRIQVTLWLTAVMSSVKGADSEGERSRGAEPRGSEMQAPASSPSGVPQASASLFQQQTDSTCDLFLSAQLVSPAAEGVLRGLRTQAPSADSVQTTLLA